MSKTTAVAMALIVGLLSISGLVSISMYVAWKQSFDEQMSVVASLAQDVLRRSDGSTDQAFAIFRALTDAHAEDPCSPDNIKLMSRLDLTSEQVQAVGYIRDNVVLCSSYGLHHTPVGDPKYLTPYGTAIRTQVVFPILPDSKFLLSTHVESGYTVAIHPSLPLDVFVHDPTVSVGVYSSIAKIPVVNRGTFRPQWIDSAGNKPEARFSDGEYLVTVKKSRQYAIAAYAAIPTTKVYEGIRHFATILVPIALIAGVALAWTIVYLARQQLALPAVLRGALKRNEFYLNYQPIVDLQTGRWVGAEALIRWRRSNGEMIRPDLFISVAEDVGLIQRITERVMELVGTQAQHLFAQYPEFHIAINLSAADLQSHNTISIIDKLVKVTKARPGNLLIEATERGFMHAKLVREILHEVRVRGIDVAIDDFGTGYSNLAYLENFELDCLKIDRTFIQTLGRGAATSQVVPHIIEMAKSLNLKIIAEGVETEEQAQFLRERGVQFAQGWLFGKAVSYAELLTALQSHELSAETIRPA